MDPDKEAKVDMMTETLDESSSGKSNKSTSTKNERKIKVLGKTVLDISIGLGVLVVLTVLLGIIPLMQLVVGIKYRTACSMNAFIPIYLIVAGVIGLIGVIISIFKSITPKSNGLMRLKFVVIVVSLAWLVTGSVWVFRAKPDVQFIDPNKRHTYCNSYVFNFAFITIILSYIFTFFSMCIC